MVAPLSRMDTLEALNIIADALGEVLANADQDNGDYAAMETVIPELLTFGGKPRVGTFDVVDAARASLTKWRDDPEHPCNLRTDRADAAYRSQVRGDYVGAQMGGGVL